MVEDRASEERGFVFGDPHRTSRSVKAEKLEVALEIFCSTVEEPEQYVGRLTRPGDRDNPLGYNNAGVKYDVKPTMPATANLPDDKVIQVWHWNTKTPHWNMNDPGDYELIFELRVEDIWRHDRWQNVAHPALPAAEKLDLSETPLALNWLKGKDLRNMNRSEIAMARRAVTAVKKEVEAQANALGTALEAMRKELEIRSEQLFFLMLYLGREVEFTCIHKGAKAADTEPVSIRQRVLYMSEEVGINSNAASWDFRNVTDFDDWVKRPENLKIVAPEQRCIVAIKPRRSEVQYSDDTLLNFFLNLENKKTYFLIRNGDTIFRVFAEIQVGDKLFPEPEEFENRYQRELSSHVSRFSMGIEFDRWEQYQERLEKRKRWYAKGFGDTAFEYPLEIIDKAEWERRHAERVDREKEAEEDPEHHLSPDELRWAKERTYKEYQEELKTFFYGLAFIEGVFDNTGIFGHIAGQVNLFTGKGKGLVKLVYDASESRLLEDKETPSLEAWLTTEAEKVKEGDLVVMSDLSSPHQLAIGKVAKVQKPGQVIVQTRMHTWRNSAKEKLMKHYLWNRGDDFSFFPFKLPHEQVLFYLERRQDRDKYWDNLLVLMLRIKLMQDRQIRPKLRTTMLNDRIKYWDPKDEEKRTSYPTPRDRRRY